MRGPLSFLPMQAWEWMLTPLLSGSKNCALLYPSNTRAWFLALDIPRSQVVGNVDLLHGHKGTVLQSIFQSLL